MQQAYHILLSKLQDFRYKFYKNQLIRGSLLSFAVWALGFLSLALVEHFGRFGLVVRQGLFWAIVVLGCIVLVFWVLRPLFKLARISQTISDKEAARLIGKHFPDVADSLLNVLQLKEQSIEDTGLIAASIQQKSEALEPIPFVRAINLRKNLRYLKYTLLPLFIFFGFWLMGSEEVITQSAGRIIDYKTVYIPPAPFDFVILNEDLETIQHQDYLLRVKVQGDKIPTEVFVDQNGALVKMQSLPDHIFEYAFLKPQADLDFRMQAASLSSELNTLTVFPAPGLVNFSIDLNYPDYTERASERIENIGDLLVPEGTRALWAFETENVDTLNLVWGEQSHPLVSSSANQFSFNKRLVESLVYILTPSNKWVSARDSSSYRLEVIKDAYPTVEVSEVVDSTSLKKRYFKGLLKDDYGFTKLQFHYEYQYFGRTVDTIIDIPVSQERNFEDFFFSIDLADFSIKAGDDVEYYFEVYDNDAVNGAKKSRSRSFKFQAPSLEELEAEQKEQTKAIKSAMEENILLAKELQEEMEELRKKLLSKEELSWEDKQALNELIEKQKELQQNIDHIDQKNKEKNAQLNEFSEQDQRILDKQKQLEELFQELMTDEMKELFEEMESLMEEMAKEDWQKKLEELKMTNEDLEKELDRNLEMLKRFEFEQALEETIDELSEVQNKQEQIKKDLEDKKAPTEDLQKLQEEVKEDFEKLSEKLDDLHDKNEALEQKQALDDTQESQEKISEKLEESKDNLENKKKKKAASSQQETLDEMEKLQQKLEQAQQQMGERGPAEDMESLRQILENLVDLSFDEEALLADLSGTNKDDPEYVSLIHWQNKLRDDSKILEDSLYALSKRQVQIKATINREMKAITNNIAKSLDNMSERETGIALEKQQLVMTSANNLALLLSDVLRSMQEDMANKMPGQQQCNKPGSSNPSMSDMKKMQEQMKKQLEEMKKGKQGEKKPNGSKGNSKELAKMSARQEMVRQQLEEMAKKIEESENGNAEGLRDAIKKMEEIENDLVNNNVTEETLKRQEEIMTRLLEAEKAEREKDQDKKREAHEADQLPHQVQDLLEEYQKQKLKQAELLKTIPTKLRPYYKEKVKEYFKNLEE